MISSPLAVSTLAPQVLSALSSCHSLPGSRNSRRTTMFGNRPFSYSTVTRAVVLLLATINVSSVFCHLDTQLDGHPHPAFQRLQRSEAHRRDHIASGSAGNRRNFTSKVGGNSTIGTTGIQSLFAIGVLDDYSCGPGRPCGNGACCGAGGFCGYGKLGSAGRR